MTFGVRWPHLPPATESDEEDQPHDEGDGGEVLRLRSVERAVALVDPQRLDPQPLQTGQHDIQGEEPALGEGVGAQSPQQGEEQEPDGDLPDRGGVHTGRGDGLAQDVALVGLRPQPSGKPGRLGRHIGREAPVAVAGDLAADSAQGVAEHHGGSGGIHRRPHLQACPANQPDSHQGRHDQAADDVEAGTGQDHRGRVSKECGQVLQDRKQPSAGDPGEEHPQPEARDEVLELLSGCHPRAGNCRVLELSAVPEAPELDAHGVHGDHHRDDQAQPEHRDG